MNGPPSIRRSLRRTRRAVDSDTMTVVVYCAPLITTGTMKGKCRVFIPVVISDNHLRRVRRGIRNFDPRYPTGPKNLPRFLWPEDEDVDKSDLIHGIYRNELMLKVSPNLTCFRRNC